MARGTELGQDQWAHVFLMSRAIKFRVWCTRFNRYHSTDVELLGSQQGLREPYDPNGLIVKYRTDVNIDGSPASLDQYDRNRFVLEQYTGLKDSTGREVYEGDIVQILCFDGWKDTTGFPVSYQVKWSTIAVGWRGFRPAMTDPSAGVDISDSPLILGNLHEHPTLLNA